MSSSNKNDVSCKSSQSTGTTTIPAVTVNVQSAFC